MCYHFLLSALRKARMGMILGLMGVLAAAGMPRAIAAPPSGAICVSPSGNDTTGDGSVAKPYKTLGKGLTVAASTTPPYIGAMNSNGTALFNAAVAWADNVTLPVSAPNNQAALIVASPTSLNGADQYLKTQLEADGYSVELVDDNNVSGGTWTTAQANAKNLVVVCESIGSSNIDNLRGMTAPVINCEPASWDNFAYVTGQTDAIVSGVTQISIVPTADPALKAGLSGTVTVYAHPFTVNGIKGTYDTDIKVVATVVGDPTAISFWNAEAGTLTNSTGRTVGFFMAGAASYNELPAGYNPMLAVAAGTYPEINLTMPGGLTLQGGWNTAFTTSTAANITTLDGTNTGRILGLDGGGASTIRNITFANANAVAGAASGGALYETATGSALSTVTLENCTFRGCVGAASGTGESPVMYLTRSITLVEIKNCKFLNNGGDTAQNGSPIRIDFSSGEVRFTGCEFTGNIFNRRLFTSEQGKSCTIQNCTFTSNQGGSDFIRIRRLSGTWTVSNCTFSGNSFGSVGIVIDDVHDAVSVNAVLTVEKCTFTSNTLTRFIRTIEDSPNVAQPVRIVLRNNVIRQSVGGAPFADLHGGTFAIVNNVLVNNTGGSGAMWRTANANGAVTGFQAVAYNNIFTGNAGYSGIFGSQSTVGNHWTGVRNNIFINNDTTPNPGTTDGTAAVTLDGRTTGNGNFSADPLFVMAAAGNFHLTSSSPAIDAGYNAAAFVTNDIDGDARPLGSAFDVGIDERLAVIVNPVSGWILFE